MLALLVGESQVATTTSSEDGTYTFSDLASGFYQVVKMPMEGCMPTTAQAMQVILPEADGTVASFLAANFGCTMEQEIDLGSIGGIVFVDENENEVYDDGEFGIGGIDVELRADGMDSKFIKTNENGEYVFDQLMAGTYEVRVSFPEVCTPVNGVSLDVELEEIEGVVEDVLDANFGCQDEVRP
jgi:hypothetical protein